MSSLRIIINEQYKNKDNCLNGKIKEARTTSLEEDITELSKIDNKGKEIIAKRLDVSPEMLDTFIFVFQKIENIPGSNGIKMKIEKIIRSKSKINSLSNNEKELTGQIKELEEKLKLGKDVKENLRIRGRIHNLKQKLNSQKRNANERNQGWKL